MKISRLNYSSRPRIIRWPNILYIAAIGIFCCCLTCCCVCVHHLFYITQHKGRLIYPRQYHQRLVYNPPRSIYTYMQDPTFFFKRRHIQKKKREIQRENKTLLYKMYIRGRSRPQTTFSTNENGSLYFIISVYIIQCSTCMQIYLGISLRRARMFF